MVPDQTRLVHKEKSLLLFMRHLCVAFSQNSIYVSSEQKSASPFSVFMFCRGIISTPNTDTLFYQSGSQTSSTLFVNITFVVLFTVVNFRLFWLDCLSTLEFVL